LRRSHVGAVGTSLLSQETVPCALADEGPTFDRLAAKSAALGAPLTPDGDWVRVGL